MSAKIWKFQVFYAKNLKPLVARWRSVGISAILYNDDGIFGFQTLEAAQVVSAMANLESSGRKSDVKTSKQDPVQGGNI